MRTLEDLKVGEWVFPCMERLAPRGAEFYEMYDVGAAVQYVGAGEFLSESGETVPGFWDVDLQLYVDCRAADGFV